MEKQTTVLVKVPYYHLAYDDPRYDEGRILYSCPEFPIELTGRYRYVRTSPSSYHIEVEYFYTPKVLVDVVVEQRYNMLAKEWSIKKETRSVVAEWEELDNDGVQIRSIKRGWVKDTDLKIEHLVYYKPEVSEIQECANGFC